MVLISFLWQVAMSDAQGRTILRSLRGQLIPDYGNLVVQYPLRVPQLLQESVMQYV